MREGRFDELARRLASRTEELRGTSSRAPLRVVRAEAPPRTMCDVTRASHIRVINHHRKWYGLQLLVDQACIGYAGIDQLPDDVLLQLHHDIDRARDCVREGVSWEDAGLIRACG